MNRLYWLNTRGNWGLYAEHEADYMIFEQAQTVGASASHGTFCYAKYPAAPPGMRWTEYWRHAGGISRRAVDESILPKPIRLLEMLNEPHASS